VVTISHPMAMRGGMVPGTYQVFSDPCVAQARATGLGNIANNQNYCVAVGTAATGAGGVAAITSAIAGTSATAVAAGIFAPLVGVAGVFAIGACLSTQANLNSMVNHIRGAAQACGSLGIVYTFRSNLGPNGANASSTLTDIVCQNASGEVGNAPPAVAGLDWKSSNSKVLTWGEAPKVAVATTNGHAKVCGGGVATGTVHHIDIDSGSSALDWTYLARKLLSRASDGSSATYTVTTWNKVTGLYEGARTATVNCFKPKTPDLQTCAISSQMLYSTNYYNTEWKSYKFLRQEPGATHVLQESKWNHITGLYDPTVEFRTGCRPKWLTLTANVTETGTFTHQGATTPVVTTRKLGPYTSTVPNLPPDSTVKLTGVHVPLTGPNTCADTVTGGVEAVSATIYSSFPGYPKVVSFGSKFWRGTITFAFGPAPGSSSTSCNGGVTWAFSTGFTLS